MDPLELSKEMTSAPEETVKETQVTSQPQPEATGDAPREAPADTPSEAQPAAPAPQPDGQVEVQPDNEPAAAEKKPATDYASLDRAALVEALREAVGREVQEAKEDVELIKQYFYKKLNQSSLPFVDITNYPTVVKEAASGYPAEKAGVEAGDLIFAVNGQNVPSFGNFKETIAGLKNDSVTLGIVRQNDTLQLGLKVDSTGLVGILTAFPLDYEPYTVGSALRYGTRDAFDLIWTNIRGLGKVFSGQEKASESLQGPIGIATIYGPVWNWDRFWFITGMLSLILAFMNILPIPGLDGGHMMFTLYEMITRKKVSDAVLEKAQMVGMGILFALIIFVFANDIFRLLS